MMNFRWCFFPLLISVFLPAASSFAQGPGELIEWLSVDGGVNWTKGLVVADGSGMGNADQKSIAAAQACRAATVVAQRNLLEITKGVRIESETVVADLMLKSDLITSKVNGLVRGARLKNRQVHDDGSCSVTMELDLEGNLASGVYGQPVATNSSFRYQNLARWWGEKFRLVNIAQAANLPEALVGNARMDNLEKRLQRLEILLTKENYQKAGSPLTSNEPTGLIIDARGAKFAPSLYPRLRETQGNIIYPAGDMKELAEQGRLLALFMNDLIMAQNHPRIGSNPLILKAADVYDKSKTDLLLSADVAARLRSLLTKDFLKKANLIIVLDS